MIDRPALTPLPGPDALRQLVGQLLAILLLTYAVSLLLRSQITGIGWLPVGMILLALMLIALALPQRHRAPPLWLLASVTACLFAAGLISVAIFGLISAGNILNILLIPMIVTIACSPAAGKAMFAAGLLCNALMAVLWSTGVLQYGFAASDYAASSTAWITLSVNTLAATLVMQFAARRLLNLLEASLRREEQLNETLSLQTKTLADLNGELEIRSATDSLTGLWNRGQFLTLGTQQLLRHRHDQSPLALLMLDIDHFKRINDQFGHPLGDQAICEVARLCKSCLRNVDILARLGGEEFAILLPHTAAEAASQVAERLRQRIADFRFRTADAGSTIQLTVSIGIAMAADDRQLDSLMARADAAAYSAKQNGRNRCALASLSASPLDAGASR